MILSPERRINQNIALTFPEYEDAAFVPPLVRIWGKLTLNSLWCQPVSGLMTQLERTTFHKSSL
jgi:hypothetical protein